MNFSLSYYGSPGDVSATLAFNDGSSASTTGLKDGNAAVKWAQKAARDYKIENTPDSTESHAVSLSGSKNFSL